MKSLSPSEKIYISDSSIPNAGRGVFASVDIKKGESIEISPIILIPEDQIRHLKDTELLNYYFKWNNQAGIALGFGSIYNHSYEPNATYKKDLKNNLLEFVSLRDIKKDEEITVNYNYGDPNDKSPLWIKSIPPAE